MMKLQENLIVLFEVQNNIESKNPRVSKTSNGKIIPSTNCTMFNRRKNHDFSKNKRPADCTQFGIRTPLSKIPLLGDILF